MMKILGFLGAMWSILTTTFLLLFSCMEGTLELKSKPAWVIPIIFILGIISAMMCFEGGFPQKYPRKRNDH